VETELFDFGNGPVEAHRHINPNKSIGGWVANTATVEPTVYIGYYAWVYGNARVSGNALVYGNANHKN
jgi:hypothetical protein